MITLADGDQTLVFLLITACLGACFIRLFWELEQARERRRLRATAKAKFPAKGGCALSARRSVPDPRVENQNRRQSQDDRPNPECRNDQEILCFQRPWVGRKPGRAD